MDHNRPDSMALGVRCLPHEGEHGQRVFWNTHVRPLGIMVLSDYTSTRPPFLGTLQWKNQSMCQQPTSEQQLFIMLYIDKHTQLSIVLYTDKLTELFIILWIYFHILN